MQAEAASAVRAIAWPTLGATADVAVESHWRIRYNEAIHPSAAALRALLDDLARGQTLQAVIDAFIASPTQELALLHRQIRGHARCAPEIRWQLRYRCLLRLRHLHALNDSCDNRSNHHDAYLLALASEAGLTHRMLATPAGRAAFRATETNERHLGCSAADQDPLRGNGWH